MTAITPPLFQTVDGAYQGRHLGIPYRDLLSEGVTTTAGLAVSQRAAGANMSVDVAAGVAWIAGDDSPAVQPLYRCYNDGVVNLAVTAAHATLARKDIVIAEVRDSAFSGVNQDWRLRVVAGTPNASPVEPALPSTALKLAVINVAAAASSITNAAITDQRVRASVLGGEAKVPAVRVRRNAAQAIAHNTNTAVSWDTEDYDTDNMWVAGSETRLTIRTPGIYMIQAGLVWSDGGDTSYRGMTIVKSGGTVLADFNDSAFNGAGKSLQTHATAAFAAGDYVETFVYHLRGSSLNLAAGFTQQSMTATMVGSV